MTPTKAQRAQLAELARRLQIPDWQERADGDGIVFVAGSRGHLKPASGALLIVLRPAASAPVRALKLQLLESGLLAGGRDGLTLARMPEDAELPAIRELLGLRKGGWA